MHLQQNCRCYNNSRWPLQLLTILQTFCDPHWKYYWWLGGCFIDQYSSSFCDPHWKTPMWLPPITTPQKFAGGITQLATSDPHWNNYRLAKSTIQHSKNLLQSFCDPHWKNYRWFLKFAGGITIPVGYYWYLEHRLLPSRNRIGNASRAHVDRRTITVVPTSFRRQRFRKDLNISVKGNNYALLKGFQTT